MEQAARAAGLFAARDYAGCTAVLQQLRSEHEMDPQVEHNLAVVEFLRGECKQPQVLVEALRSVKASCEQLAWQAEAQMEGVGTQSSLTGGTSDGGLPTPGIPKSPPKSPITSTGPSSLSYTKEYDPSLPILNTAIVLSHLHQYVDCLALLEPLYNRLEPLDEGAAITICLLMVHMWLEARQPAKALAVIGSMEKQFARHLERSVGAGADGAGDAVHEGIPVELHTWLQLFKARLYLLVGSTTSAKGVAGEVDTALAAAPKPPAAKAERASLTQRATLLLRAQAEWQAGRPKDAVSALMRAGGARSEAPGVRALVLNNLGCVCLSQHKHQLALVYFSQAWSNAMMAAAGDGGGAKGSPAGVLAQDKRMQIAYNAGLAALHAGQYAAALGCFQEALKAFHRQPLAWLRLAECCVQAHLAHRAALHGARGRLHTAEPGGTEPHSGGGTEPHSGGKVKAAAAGDAVAAAVGKSHFRRLVVPPTLLEPGASVQGWSDGEARGGRGDGTDTADAAGGIDVHTGTLSLECAAMWLRNAAALLRDTPVTTASKADKDMADGGKGGVGSKGSGSKVAAALEAFGAADAAARDVVRAAVHVQTAHVYLLSDHPLGALSAAEALLAAPRCAGGGPGVLLARLYAAEALAAMGRPAEAAEHLTAAMMDQHADDGASARGASGGGSKEAQAEAVKEDKVAVYVNLAAVYATQREFAQAQQCAAQALAVAPASSHALLAAVFVELAQGRGDAAIALLRRRRVPPTLHP